MAGKGTGSRRKAAQTDRTTVCFRQTHRHLRRPDRSIIADRIRDRDFRADRTNQKQLADVTYILTSEGWLNVAVVLDLFARRVVSWSMQAKAAPTQRSKASIPGSGLLSGVSFQNPKIA